jgi:DNA (cytosine-5)-methyltransferase 1
MTKFKEWSIESNVDVLVGGTPCQSFSVAGLRKGLDDPRGNLMLTYLAIADKYRPKWLVWENVPGVLSSNGGLDFASFLRGLGELGYGFAYRVLDAQYFGVAQRRRRVFVVGYLGDWQRAAAVLFERDSLCGNPAPSREKREGVAASTGASPSVGSLCARTGQSISVQDAAQGHLMATWPAKISSTLDTTFGTKQGLENQHVNAGCPMFVPAPLFVTSGQANAAFSLDVGLALNSSHESPYVVQPIASHDVAGTMLSRNTSGGFSNSIDHAAAGYMAIQPMPINTMVALRHEALGEGTGFGIGAAGDPAYTITKGHSHAVAQPITYNIAPGKGALKDDIHVTTADATKTLDASGSNPAMHQGGAAILQSMAVRRLTPVECERLQGFPDTYTDIKSKGKATPDGPRYKALGNSMAVPVMAWIGKRINEVEELCKPNK